MNLATTREKSGLDRMKFWIRKGIRILFSSYERKPEGTAGCLREWALLDCCGEVNMLRRI